MFVNREGQVRSGWKILTLFLVFMGVVIVCGILTDVLFQLGMVTKAQLISVNQEVSQIFMILSTIFCWKVIFKGTLSALGVRFRLHSVKQVAGGLLFGAISVSLVWGFLLLSGNAKVSFSDLYFGKELFTGLVVFILVGFSEEILGRGYIMGVLRQTRSALLAIVVSSIIFSLLHGSNPGIGVLPFINICLVGILLAYIYVKSGSLWTCIGYHISWNYFLGYIYGFLVSGQETKGVITTELTGNDVVTGGAFGPEGGLVVTVLLLISIFLVKWCYRHSKYNFIRNQ